MLQWIAGYVARWTGIVAQGTIDLVHWAVHALAGVVYGVFGHVGAAWKLLWAAMVAAHTAADRFAAEVLGKFTEIIRVDLPQLWRYAVAAFRAAEALALRYYRDALQAVEAALRVAKALVQALRVYVDTRILAPLSALIRQLRADLLKWGYVAWYYVTHPDKLAPVLLDAMVAAAEAAFDRLAAPVGTFALRLIVKNLPRLLVLAEDVIKAVL